MQGPERTQRCFFWEHQRGGCLLSETVERGWWWESGTLSCFGYNKQIIFLCLFYLKSRFLFIFFYIREAANRRKGGMMGREGRRGDKCPSRPLEAPRKRSHHLLLSPSPCDSSGQGETVFYDLFLDLFLLPPSG